IREWDVRLTHTEHRTRGRHAVLSGVVVMLDAETPTVTGMPPVGHVARRVDIRRRRLAQFIDDDAVVDLETGIPREIDIRAHTNSDDHQIAGDLFAIRQHGRLDLTVA